jgi:glutamyl-tRNA reductase
MRLVAVGLSHRSAELDLRGTVAFDEARRRCLLANLKEAGAAEAAVIATCNRTELYVAGPDPSTVDALARAELADVAGQEQAVLEPALYHLRDDVAALHLCRVAAGLDSLVPGEVEILGQVREALLVAEEEGTIGPLLYRAFQCALEAGKRVRSETGIAAQNASVASVAAELARSRLGGLEGRSAVLIGAGHTSELAALNLMGRGLRDMVVSTRTFASAVTLADRLGASAVRFEEVHERLGSADLVVSSTSAPHAVLAADTVRRAVAARTGQPLLLIDLAVPRDIEPEVRGIEGCDLHDLDDLRAVVARNVALREQEASAAEEICAAHAEQFREWQASRVVVPSIVQLRERGELLAAEEVARAAAGWPALDEDERARLERLGRAIVRRLLHEPTVRLREGAAASDGVAYAETVRDLFGLELPDSTPAPDA